MSKITQKNKELKAKEKQTNEPKTKKTAATELAEKKASNCSNCANHKNNPSWCKVKKCYCARKADACDKHKPKA